MNLRQKNIWEQTGLGNNSKTEIQYGLVVRKPHVCKIATLQQHIISMPNSISSGLV